MRPKLEVRESWAVAGGDPVACVAGVVGEVWLEACSWDAGGGGGDGLLAGGLVAGWLLEAWRGFLRMVRSRLLRMRVSRSMRGISCKAAVAGTPNDCKS